MKQENQLAFRQSVSDLVRRLGAAADASPAWVASEGDRSAELAAFSELLREAKEALQQNEDTLRQITAMVESSHDAIIGASSKGVISSWNPGAEAIFGYSPAEAIGQPLSLLAPPDRVGELRQTMERLKRGERINAFETIRLRKDGRRVHVSLSIAAVKDDSGVVTGALGVAKDMTAQLNLEAQLWQAHKMESIGILARGIAHNFNNILAVIQGYASLLMMTDDLPAPVTDYARKISQSTDRAATLTRQLLAFSQREEMQRDNLDLNQVVESMAAMLQPILGEDITLRVNTKIDLSMVHADLGKLEQILLNLAVNARDAMPRGGQLFITTDTVMVDEDHARRNREAACGKFVVLSVSDSGSGIASEHLPHVFDPFFTTKEVGKGIGLGLSIVYGIVKQHAGWIEIDTAVGKGTTVRVFLPAQESTVEAGAAPAVAGKMRVGTETVLLVEDESSLRGPVRSILERQGFHVLEAGSGVEALAVWRHHQSSIDLLLVDVVMPDGMSGPDLAETLRVDNPRLRVLFTSGYTADVAGLHWPMKKGVSFLQKPYHADKLVDAVRDCLDSAP
jgi:PAS domain S-box-containing protein